jgi:hypothetical protein
MQAKVDEINEAINRILEARFADGSAAIRDAATQLAALNQELVVARQRNEKLKSGLAIAAQVMQVVAGVASLI